MWIRDGGPFHPILLPPSKGRRRELDCATIWKVFYTVRPVILYSRFHSLLTTNSHVVTDRGQAFVKPKRCKFDLEGGGGTLVKALVKLY